MFLEEISDDFLINLYRDGIQWGIDLLYERYSVFLYGFIHRVLKTSNVYCDYKEVYQELFLVLINCIERYDEEAGCFYFFVKCAAERKLYDYINKINRDKNISSLDELCFFNGNETCLDYVEESDDQMYYETELYKMLDEVLERDDMKIINMKVEGYTYQEIADSFGVNKQFVYRKMVHIKNIIKDIIEKID